MCFCGDFLIRQRPSLRGQAGSFLARPFPSLRLSAHHTLPPFTSLSSSQIPTLPPIRFYTTLSPPAAGVLSPVRRSPSRALHARYLHCTQNGFFERRHRFTRQSRQQWRRADSEPACRQGRASRIATGHESRVLLTRVSPHSPVKKSSIMRFGARETAQHISSAQVTLAEHPTR